MDIKPIKTEADYQAALVKIDSLMDASHDTPEGDFLDILTTLVTAYEEKHYPIDMPNPIDAIQHALESKSMTDKDLEELLECSRTRVWEIMHYKRKLSISMIRKLNDSIGIPADVLIKEYDVENVTTLSNSIQQ